MSAAQKRRLERQSSHHSGASSCRFAMSSAGGMAVSLAAALARVPQIASIIKSSSVDGINQTTVTGETVAYLVSTLFHRSKSLPFDTYGECVAFTAQNSTILALWVLYRKPPLKQHQKNKCAAAVVVVVALLLHIDRNRHRPAYVRGLEVLQSASMIGCQVARVPQIYTNYSNGSTGNLSVIPWLLNTAGSTFRFKTSTEPVLRMGFGASILVNLCVVAQILYYNNKKGGKKAKE
jgi:mannose-P-dolichol utilization defect protein 1